MTLRVVPDDHLTRMSYSHEVDALFDAVRVHDDLLEVLDGQLVVPVDQLLFLARRARSLTLACAESAHERWHAERGAGEGR